MLHLVADERNKVTATELDAAENEVVSRCWEHRCRSTSTV